MRTRSYHLFIMPLWSTSAGTLQTLFSIFYHSHNVRYTFTDVEIFMLILYAFFFFRKYKIRKFVPRSYAEFYKLLGALNEFSHVRSINYFYCNELYYHKVWKHSGFAESTRCWKYGFKWTLLLDGMMVRMILLESRWFNYLN